MAFVPQDLPVPLAFWDAKEKQFFRRFYCSAKDEFSALQCRYDRMLPWVIKNQSGTPTYVYLVQSDGSFSLDITTLLTITNETVDGVDYCLHGGGSDINQATSVSEYGWNGTAWAFRSNKTWAEWVSPSRYYYLEINFGGTRYYSELLQIQDFPEVANDPMGCTEPRIRVECSNNCAVGPVPSLSGYAPKFFIVGETSQPEYLVEKQVSTDGEEEETVIWAKAKKRYKIIFPANETLADFVSTMPLYDTVNIADQNGFQADVTDVSFRITWENDCLANIELSYSIVHVAQAFCC